MTVYSIKETFLIRDFEDLKNILKGYNCETKIVNIIENWNKTYVETALAKIDGADFIVRSVDFDFVINEIGY